MSDFDDSDLDIDLTPPPVGTQYHPAETEDVLLQLRDVIEAARPVPLSASSMIAKEEVLELVDEALAQLPEELRAARWLLKEREEFLARTRHEADEMLDQARTRAERMVQRTEVVKAAEARAYEIVEAAAGRRPSPASRGRGLLRSEARQLRDRPRAHPDAGRRRSGQAPGHQPAGRGGRGRGRRGGAHRPRRGGRIRRHDRRPPERGRHRTPRPPRPTTTPTPTPTPTTTTATTPTTATSTTIRCSATGRAGSRS